MKKKILALVASLFMIFSLVGCNKEGVNLIQKLQEVSQWPDMEQVGDMEVNAELNGKKYGVAFNYIADTTNSMQTEMTMNIKEIEVDGTTIDTVADKDKKIPAVKCYMDGAKFYVSTDLLKRVSEMTGEKLPEKIDVTKEYFVLDLGDMAKQSGIDMSKEGIKELNDRTYKELRSSDVELPIEQDSNKYTVELNTKQMVEAGSKYAVQTMKTNKATLKAQYKKSGMTDDQIDQVFEKTNEMLGTDMQAQLVKAMDGSKAKLVYTFNKDEDEYTLAMEANLNIAQDNQKVALEIKANSKVKKADKVNINIPSSVTTCKMDEFMKMFGASTVTVEDEKVAEETVTEDKKADKEETVTEDKKASKEEAATEDKKADKEETATK